MNFQEHCLARSFSAALTIAQRSPSSPLCIHLSSSDGTHLLTWLQSWHHTSSSPHNQMRQQLSMCQKRSAKSWGVGVFSLHRYHAYWIIYDLTTSRAAVTTTKKTPPQNQKTTKSLDSQRTTPRLTTQSFEGRTEAVQVLCTFLRLWPNQRPKTSRVLRDVLLETSP